MKFALPYNDNFWCTGGKSLLKTLWGKKKMLVSKMFSILWKTTSIFWVTFNLSSANAFSLGQSEILLSGNGLKTLEILQKYYNQHWILEKLSYNRSITSLTNLRKKPFENIVRKGENAGNQHFLLFPQCFLLFLTQITIFQSHLFCRLQVLSIRTSVKICCLVELTHSHAITPFDAPGKQAFWKHRGKRRNCS